MYTTVLYPREAKVCKVKNPSFKKKKLAKIQSIIQNS